MSKIVVALGGNALGQSPEEQLELVKGTAKSLVSLIQKGYEVVISHGNGPQVGSINLGLNYALKMVRTSVPIPRMWRNESSLHWLSTTRKLIK